jgi:hypothetical protein
MRCEILIRLGKPVDALSVLQPLTAEFTSGSPYYLLGKALEQTADKRAAIDACLECVLRPSEDQQRANAALEALWSSERLGSDQDLQQRIEARLVQNFSSANYAALLRSPNAPTHPGVVCLWEIGLMTVTPGSGWYFETVGNALGEYNITITS